MSARKLIALGTASQVPTRERNHNGYFLRWDEEGLLFDPGEGTQRQMILAGVAASEITKILLTHFHGDHCLGLPGVLQRLSLDRVTHRVDLFYPASGAKYLENLRNASIYHNVAHIEPHSVSTPGIVFENDKFSIEAQPLDHTVESWGWRIEEPDTVTMLPEQLAGFGIRGKAVGLLKQQGWLQIGDRMISIEEVSVKKKGQSLAFVMDTGVCTAAETLARGADVLVCESTYLSSEEDEAIARKHLTAAQAAGIAHRAGVQQLVLTHFSQRYRTTDAFVAEAELIHPKVVAVRDGDVIEFARTRTSEGNSV